VEARSRFFSLSPESTAGARDSCKHPANRICLSKSVNLSIHIYLSVYLTIYPKLVEARRRFFSPPSLESTVGARDYYTQTQTYLYLSIYLSVYLSIYLSIYQSINLKLVGLAPGKRFFLIPSLQSTVGAAR